MKEHPILFSGPMVRAILEGRKTQTRRVVKPCPDGFEWAVKHSGDTFTNTLWDGEQWITHNIPISCDCLVYTGPMQRCVDPTGSSNMEWFQWESTPLTCPYGQIDNLLWVRETWAVNHNYDEWKPSDLEPGLLSLDLNYAASWVDKPGYLGKIRPSIFMPRWASRLTLKIIDVRVERLQEISEDDAKAEGVSPWHDTIDGIVYKPEFVSLWDSINAKRPGCAWNDNPYVWVIEFRKMDSKK